MTVFEKADRIGGLLRYGIPDFKMEKTRARPPPRADDGRGRDFQTNAHVGGNIPAKDLRKEFDAILLAGGAESPRDLNVPGRELKGIHFAMEFLPQQNKRIAGDDVPDQILATGKRVVIIGGGDTGADCLGTCHRQQGEVRAASSKSCPCRRRSAHASTPWPLWPLQLRTESAHEEGGVRDWAAEHHEIYGRREWQRETAARRARRAAAEIRSRCPARNSPSRQISSCSRWVSPVR